MKNGYTLIEMLLVLGILGVLFSIGGILVSDLIPKASVVSISTTLLADVRNQQLRAMLGESYADNAGPHGVYITSNQYVLFEGASYNVADPDNVTIAVNPPYTLSTTFPNTTLVFAQLTGEIVSYASETASITIQNSESSTAETMQFNQLGVPTEL